MNFKAGALFLAVVLLALPARADDKGLLKTREDKISYAAGVEMGRNFRRQELSINPELLLKGVQDEMAGKDMLLSDLERRSVMREMQNEVRTNMARKRQVEGPENLKKAEEFLTANKTEEGVYALASGLQYRIIKEGDGKIPSEDDTVECNYLVTHLDGTEFDGTDPGKPATMKVAKLLPGWKEAMKIMPVGSTWQLFIPAKLAYGDQGAGYEIGPNELLIFKVDLLAIK